MRPGSARLPGVVLRELRRAVELLDRIATPVEDPVLKAFREDFVRRYETREVPLAEALDPDWGLPLRDDWSSRQPPATARARTLVLLELAERGRATGEVELTDEDVARLEHAQRVPLPDAFVVTATLLARDAGALDAGDFMVAGPSVIGPSGARLLGRLCDGDDELAAHVLRHLRQEEGLQPGVAFAELATLPDTAWALSVSHRPVLRDWEVECGGTSGADPARRLPLEDLLVSVDGEEIVLRSLRLGRRVEVRATTAVNTDWVPFPAARFLRRLEGRGHDTTREWSWGPLHDAPHLPRVRHGRIVVAPRRWYLRGPEAAATDAARFRQVQAWRHAHDLPRVVSFDAAKAPVVIDFDNALSVEAFLAWSRRVERLRLVEVAPEEQCPVTGEDGRYAHDLVVPFTCEVQPPRRAPRAAARAVIAGRRPGACHRGRTGSTPSSTARRRRSTRCCSPSCGLWRRGSPKPRRSTAGSSSGTPTRIRTCACACTALQTACWPRRCPICCRPRRPPWRPGSSTGSRWTPTSARSSATADPRASR